MFILKNVSKNYNQDIALDDISMTINSGLNFIIGASGSGKTTLLKIISAMDTNYVGQVLFNNTDLKTLNNQTKAQYYNQVFGFIWQDFNLIENQSVIENILLPTYLQDSDKLKKAHSILKELKISELEKQTVSKLSGGQKQRVAIARELMKDPKVILADEPTSALDSESIKNIMDILKTLSKKRCVIIVTHDTSLITKDANVFELDKGQLISCTQSTNNAKATNLKLSNNSFNIAKGFKLAINSLKCNISKTISLLIALIISTLFLMVSLSGNIQSNNNDAFEQLINTYGETILDISLASSFMSASGTDNSDGGPNSNVNQKLDGLYELYQNDSRVEYVLYSQPLDNITITLNQKEYQVQSTGNVPVLNYLVAGSLPTGKENQVIVPESFVESLNLSNDEIIGQQITINGGIYDWSTGFPDLKQVQVNVVVSGVIDTKIVVDYNGKPYTYSIDDSFFFNEAALKQMRETVGMNPYPDNFIMRAKNPSDMIALKDELTKNGILPIGQFELVEDIVRLNTQTSTQSSSATILIAILALIISFSLSLFSAIFRKREFAIYKLCGFSKKELNLTLIAEALLFTLLTNIVFVILSPILNIFTKQTLNTNILNTQSIVIAIIVISTLSLMALLINVFVAQTTNTQLVLKGGSKS